MTKQADHIYRINHIRHYYNHRKVLEIDSLTIKKGTITGLIGPNGSGKSTFLKLMAFAEKPTEGEILFNGIPEVPYSKQVRSKVTLLTQEPYLLKRTVYENIAYGLKIRGDNNHLNQRIKTVLENVGLDFHQFARRKWNELSGGEAQRVALAARLILNPEILLLDEPTASVDVKSAKMIRNAALKAKEDSGTTLVVASHDLHWLYEISDRQLHLFNGRVFSSGMENIIMGPWEKADPVHVVCRLGNNQQIMAIKPHQKQKVGLIRKENIRINLPGASEKPFDNCLEGPVTRMILERKTMAVITTVTIEDLLFTLRLDQEKIKRLNLLPGKTITLEFNKDAVEWI